MDLRATGANGHWGPAVAPGDAFEGGGEVVTSLAYERLTRAPFQ